MLRSMAFGRRLREQLEALERAAEPADARLLLAEHQRADEPVVLDAELPVRDAPRALREIDELLGYSVRKLCLEDSNKQLSQTQYTQPCLYVVNALHYYKAVSGGARPESEPGARPPRTVW